MKLLDEHRQAGRQAGRQAERTTNRPCSSLQDNISQLFPISSFLSFLSSLLYKMGETKSLPWFEPRWHAIYRGEHFRVAVDTPARVFCFFLFISESARKLETGKASKTCWSTVACVGKLSGNIHLSFLWIDGVYVFVGTLVQKASLWFLHVVTSGKEWHKIIVSLFFRLFSFKNLTLWLQVFM